MVNTMIMHSDEYSHYVLRYSAIQSGFAEFNLAHPSEGDDRDEFMAGVLEGMYTDTFVKLMELLDTLPEDRRGRSLDHMIQTIERFDLVHRS